MSASVQMIAGRSLARLESRSKKGCVVFCWLRSLNPKPQNPEPFLGILAKVCPSVSAETLSWIRFG